MSIITISQSITWVAVLINVANIFYCDAKHRIFGSIKTNGLDFIPPALLVNVNIHGPSNFSISVKILWGSNNYILPPKNITRDKTEPSAKIPASSQRTPSAKVLRTQRRDAERTSNLELISHPLKHF